MKKSDNGFNLLEALQFIINRNAIKVDDKSLALLNTDENFILDKSI